MKKFVAILLCAVMLFSIASVFAFADDDTATEMVTVTFINYDGSVYYETEVEKGTAPAGPEINPERPHEDGKPEYEFMGWIGPDGETYYRSTLPIVTENTPFTAEFRELRNDENTITVMSFLASIFYRINKIFEAISTYFEDLTKSVEKLMNNI